MDLGGTWGAEAPPPKLYYVLARKVHSRSYSTGAITSKAYMDNDKMERVRIEELISSRNPLKLYFSRKIALKTVKHQNTLIKQSTILIKRPSLTFLITIKNKDQFLDSLNFNF